MKRSIALAISYLFHPALMPTVGALILLYVSPYYFPPEVRLYAATFIFASTYLFPALSVILMQRLGMISDLHMKEGKERRLPFIATAIFFYFCAQTLKNFPLPPIFSTFVLGCALVIVISFLFLKWWKVSIHAAGMSGIIALVVYLAVRYDLRLIWPIAGLFFAAGVLGTVRLYLRSHNLFEVLLGYLIGGGTVWLVINYF